MQPQPRVVVAVISMEGCEACADYVPRLQAITPSYERAGISVMFIDAQDPRPEAQAWMDKYKITATPTTLVLKNLDYGGGVWKLEGSQSDAAIKQLMDFAYSQAVR